MGLPHRPPSESLNSVCTCPPHPAEPPLYLVSADLPLGHLQALARVDETNFGSSLGRKPVPLYQVHDHHMVFQAGTKGSYLKGGVHNLPLLGRFHRHSGAPCDTGNLVTSASQPGKHNFLCLMQVLSAAGGVWDRLQCRPVFSNFTDSCSKNPCYRGAHNIVVEVPWVTFKCHEKTSSAAAWPTPASRLGSEVLLSSLISKRHVSFSLVCCSPLRCRR